MTYFFYGTLTCAEVLADVLGHVPLPGRVRPGSLCGYRLVRLRDQPYLSLRKAAGGMVKGIVLRDANAAATDRLVRYEGAAYRTILVTVRAGSRTIRARTFVAKPGVAVRGLRSEEGEHESGPAWPQGRRNSGGLKPQVSPAGPCSRRPCA